jgi:hypothetical protein
VRACKRLHAKGFLPVVVLVEFLDAPFVLHSSSAFGTVSPERVVHLVYSVQHRPTKREKRERGLLEDQLLLPIQYNPRSSSLLVPTSVDR